jgi:uncharacterized protein (TIGR03067 family)
MLRAEYAGAAAPELVTKHTVLTFREGIYIVSFNGAETDRGTYTSIVSPERRVIILHGERGSNAGCTIPCIYQVSGDRLRVCYGLDKTMPTDFTTVSGTLRYLAWYRRTTR